MEINNLDNINITTSCLALYLRDIQKYEPLTKEEQDEIWEHRTAAGIEKIINSHLPMVISIVNKIFPYTPANESDFMDLVQAGNEGLVKATQNFDPKLSKFTTHSYNWVTTYVKNELIQKRNGLIKKPAHIINSMSLVAKTAQKLESILEREPTSDEMVTALADVFTKEKVEELLSVKDIKVLSLDKPHGEDGEATLADTISGEDDIEAEREKIEFQERIIKILRESLDDKLCLLVCARYGLGEFRGQKQYTLEEVARLFVERGFASKVATKEWIRQLETKALNKLRRNQNLVELLKQNQ